MPAPDRRVTHNPVSGVVLAGGMSRRMGGPEKALMTLAGAPLVAHAVRGLAPQVASLILNANGDPARFAALALTVVPDETADRPGPLAGILTALHWFARHAPEAAAVVSLPADTPLVPHDLVARLRDGLAASPGASVAVAESRGRRHPVIALWTFRAANEIEAALARGERTAHAMIDRLGAVSVPFPDLDIAGRAIDPFFNVNTPEDLAAAEEILSGFPPPLWAREGGIAERQPSGFPQPFIVGIAGWKNSGKTTLVTRLVAELATRGYRVSTVKSSHHVITSEVEGSDSDRHRKAGAREVALISPAGWALIGNVAKFTVNPPPAPPLEDIVARLAPTDIVLVEGVKHAPIPKIEVRRKAQGPGPPLAPSDPRVFAVAADHDVEGANVSVLSLDDLEGITHAVLAKGRLPDRKAPQR